MCAVSLRIAGRADKLSLGMSIDNICASLCVCVLISPFPIAFSICPEFVLFTESSVHNFESISMTVCARWLCPSLSVYTASLCQVIMSLTSCHFMLSFVLVFDVCHSCLKYEWKKHQYAYSLHSNIFRQPSLTKKSSCFYTGAASCLH